jgi:hypothetical protein
LGDIEKGDFFTTPLTPERGLASSDFVLDFELARFWADLLFPPRWLFFPVAFASCGRGSPAGLPGPPYFSGLISRLFTPLYFPEIRPGRAGGLPLAS